MMKFDTITPEKPVNPVSPNAVASIGFGIKSPGRASSVAHNAWCEKAARQTHANAQPTVGACGANKSTVIRQQGIVSASLRAVSMGRPSLRNHGDKNPPHRQ